MRLEVSLLSFKLAPLPTLELPPSTIMGGDVWSWIGGFKSCFCHPLPLVPRVISLGLSLLLYILWTVLNPAFSIPLSKYAVGFFVREAL